VTLLELFSGCGGAALGLARAGWEHLACIERDDAAAETLAAAGLPVLHADVRDVHYRPFAGRTDLLWASPPCQAGSTAGKRRGVNDDRNGWPWTLDVIDTVKPTWFLAENVLGWTYHRKGCDRRGHDLTCTGCYWSGWLFPQLRQRFPFVGSWVMNAADYGTPQHRRRVILWAGPLPLSQSPPAPSHADTDVRTLGPGEQPWVSMAESVGDTLNRQSCDWRRCYPCDGTHGRACTESDRIARPSPALTASESRGTRANAKAGWSFNGGPDRASDAAFLIAGIRRVSLDEALTLQGFPPDWPMRGGIGDQYRQLGNAVPPQLSEAAGRAIAIAEQVRRRLEHHDLPAMTRALHASGQTLPVSV